MDKGETAERYFREGYNCAQAVAATFAPELGLSPEDAARLVSGFGGGLGRMRSVCGAVSGMVFVLGALRGAGSERDPAVKTALYAQVQAAVKGFAAENGSYVCAELLGAAPRPDAPAPAARTPEYYRKRPCPELVRGAAERVARLLAGAE